MTDAIIHVDDPVVQVVVAEEYPVDISVEQYQIQVEVVGVPGPPGPPGAPGQVPPGTITGTGTSGQVPVWSGASTQSGSDKLAVDPNGQLIVKANRGTGAAGLQLWDTNTGQKVVLNALHDGSIYITNVAGTAVPITAASFANPADGSSFWNGYQQWRISAGRFIIGQAFDLTQDTQLGVLVTDPVRRGLAIRLASAQTAPAIEVRNAAGTPILEVSSAGVFTQATTFSGNLTVNRTGGTSCVFLISTSGTAYYQARSAVGTQAGLQIVDHTSGFARWVIGKSTANESGSNVGSNLSITAYSDSGAFLSTALLIDRPTGLITVKGDPTAALGVATKQYTDTKWTMWSGTQAAYDAIGTKDPNTLYAITG